MYRRGNENENGDGQSHHNTKTCKLKLVWDNFISLPNRFYKGSKCLIIPMLVTVYVKDGLWFFCWPQKVKQHPPPWGAIWQFCPKIPTHMPFGEGYTWCRQNGIAIESYLFSTDHSRNILESIKYISTLNWSRWLWHISVVR